MSSPQALGFISAAASHAGNAGVEETTAAPALTETATPSTSAISSLVAPRSRAAAVCTVMQPSQRRVMAIASANELAGLVIEVTGLLAGPAQGGVALDDIGVELAEVADPGDKLLPICILS